MTITWDVAPLDLGAYLARMGAQARTPSVDALAQLHRAHLYAIPFENVDVLLEQHRGVGLDVVTEKMLGRRRGGYCYEHATLFAAALERLGYQVQRLLARVGDPVRASRSHAVVVVTVDGQRYLADPGFGLSIIDPIPLEDGAEQEVFGHRVRLVRGASGDVTTWQLQRKGDHGWDVLHTTDELPAIPADLRVANYYTSLAPDSHFTSGASFARHTPGGHIAVSSTAVTWRTEGEQTLHRDWDLEELPQLLKSLAIELTVDEVDRLRGRLSALRDAE